MCSLKNIRPTYKSVVSGLNILSSTLSNLPIYSSASFYVLIPLVLASAIITSTLSDISDFSAYERTIY